MNRIENDLKKNVIFVYNRFYQGREELGPTSSWEKTWLNSISSFFGPSVRTFNPDLFGPSSHFESDATLMKMIDESKPDILIMIYHIGYKWTRDFISRESLMEIKQRDIHIVSIWGDIHIPEQRRQLKALSEFTSINLCSETESVISRMNMKEKIQYVWVPIQEKPISSKESCNCGNAVSFAGKLKEKRGRIINYLVKNGIKLHVGGGEGSGTLSREQYMQLIAHPMTISFSGSILQSVTNARTFEALSQRSLLLEKWGTETCKILEPYIDYVPWFSKKDLKEKIDYYTKNIDRAKEIAESGNRKYIRYYSNDNLWNLALSRIYINHEIQNIDSGFARKMNLKKIPLVIKYLSKGIEFISSHRVYGKSFDLSARFVDKFRSEIRNVRQGLFGLN
jgi:hypothetical protein